jgi:hypothetical protein
MTFEPDILRIGKAFGVRVQTEYPRGAEDVRSHAERKVKRGSGRRVWLEDGTVVEPPDARLGREGRVDLLLEGVDDGMELPFKVVLEIKRTDWDRQAEHRVSPNLGRSRRQVWSYLEPLEEQVQAGELAWVQAVLVYPHRPKTAGRDAYIEEALAGYGINVVWYDGLPA